MTSLENNCKKSFVVRAYKSVSDYTNLKWNLVGGFFGGLSAYYFNFDHGLWASLSAGSKQIGYNLLMAGINVKMCERLGTEIKNKNKAMITSTLIPSMSAVGLNYLMHKLTGTPDAFESVYLPMATAPPFFFIMGQIYRKNSHQKT